MSFRTFHWQGGQLARAPVWLLCLVIFALGCTLVGVLWGLPGWLLLHVVFPRR